jgi:hypothetical protein
MSDERGEGLKEFEEFEGFKEFEDTVGKFGWGTVERYLGRAWP